MSEKLRRLDTNYAEGFRQVVSLVLYFSFPLMYYVLQEFNIVYFDYKTYRNVQFFYSGHPFSRAHLRHSRLPHSAALVHVSLSKVHPFS